MTRDTRVLDQYDKYLKTWFSQSNTLKHERSTRLATGIGISPLTRKVNIDQAKNDLSLIERFELYQEKVNQQEILNIAINPNELQYGSSHFQWGLRNAYKTELQEHGHELDAYDSLDMELKDRLKTGKPPKPSTAQSTIKRQNLEFVSNGDPICVKKVPDFQKVAVAKVKPFSLLRDRPNTTLDPTLTSTLVNDKGYKTYSDFKSVTKQLKLNEKRIDKVKNYSDFENLTQIYLKGESKLAREVEAAKRIAAPQRKLVVVNESIAKQAMSTAAMQASYGRIASKLLPEDEQEDNKGETAVGVAQTSGAGVKRVATTKHKD